MDQQTITLKPGLTVNTARGTGVILYPEFPDRHTGAWWCLYESGTAYVVTPNEILDDTKKGD